MAKVDPKVEDYYKRLLKELVALQRTLEAQERALKLDKANRKSYEKTVDMGSVGSKILAEIKAMKASAPGKIAGAAKQMGKALDKQLAEEHKKAAKLLNSFESDEQKALQALMKATSKDVGAFIKSMNDSAANTEKQLALAA